MRELIILKNQQDVRNLIAYLAVQGIEATVEQENGNWVVWILNDDDREAAQQIAADFQQKPGDPKYESAERKVRHVLIEADRLQQENRQRVERLRKRWSGSWWHCYPATYIMIGVCIAVVALCTQWKPLQTDSMGMPQFCNRQDSELLSKMKMYNKAAEAAYSKSLLEGLHLTIQVQFNDQKVPVGARLSDPPRLTPTEQKLLHIRCAASALLPLIRSGELWRFVTPAFIHLNLLHIIMNMLAFRNLGCGVEYLRGTGRYLVLCLILAVGSSTVQFLWAGPGFGGMSGVLFGLVGYIWMKGRTRPEDGLGLTSRGITMAFLWLVMCMAGVFGNIANGAHLGGFVVGILIGARHAIWKRIPFAK
ncbi:MAG: rhomboid family intramembrane serine protease [Planctomycetaceae bacterium]